MKTINVLFCGKGGQGVLKAAEILALAAMYAGYSVKKAETHGMSQRGGSVETHVRYGKEVFSPTISIGEADFLVPFFPSEHDRLINYLSPTGTDLLSTLLTAEKELTDKRFINTYMLGVLAAKLSIPDEHWVKALEIGFKGKLLKENVEVFISAKPAK
jgi:indolepyruvate ferredoxin oxidoreductase beta subunit